MSKLSFRPKTLDNCKPMPIYMAEELPDLPDFSAINRAVPQMPSGMQKEEECEHHLQRAIVAGLIIPTPEVTDMPNREYYDKVYPTNYKQPRKLINMQPFTMEQDIPDYDMDSEDERWLHSQTQKLDLSPLKFEEMMDRLEKSSGQTVVTLNEAKALLKEDDDLIIAVYDYWLNKRLKTQHPLILTVKTEHRSGTAANNPYLAFRRRTDKMQTRKHRKNDEASYEKMLKLRRDLYRAVTLLELVKRREKIKREYVHLTVEVFEKRFQAKDFSGEVLAEASAAKAASRPAFTPIFHNHYTNQSWSNKTALKDEVLPRREKRPYRKRKHKSIGRPSGMGSGGTDSLCVSSDEDVPMHQLSPETTEEVQEDEGQFAFRRNKSCSYHMPLKTQGNWPWCSKEENGQADPRYRFTLTSLSKPRMCIGFARRRIGRGGRVILDRVATDYDDLWRTLDFSIVEPQRNVKSTTTLYPISTAPHDESTVVVKSEVSSATSSFVSNAGASSSSTWTNDGYSNFDSSVICSGTSGSTSVRSSNSFISHQIDIATATTASSAATSYNFGVKKEQMDLKEEDGVALLEDIQRQDAVTVKTEEDKEGMVEFLRSLRRDWLHFRPKTPPPDWEPPCDMLLCQDTFFDPCSANVPFSMEVHALEPSNNSLLLDKTSFITEPFGSMLDIPESIGTSSSTSTMTSSKTGSTVMPSSGVMASTTSQTSSSSSSSQDTLVNTLTLPHSVSLSSTYGYDTNSRDSTSSSDSSSDYRTIGCTTFRVTDCGETSSSCNGSNNDVGVSGSGDATTSNNSRQYQQQQKGGNSNSGSSNSQQTHSRSHPQSRRTTGSHNGSGTSSTNSGGGGVSSGTSTTSSSLSVSGGNFTLTSRKVVGTNSNIAPMSGTSRVVGTAALTTPTTTMTTLTTMPTIEDESVLSVRLGTTAGTARPRGGNTADSTNTLGTNGLLTPFGFDAVQNRPKNNKLSYAYPGAGYQNASPSTLSLHTSAHTLTLNSHSANILDIPMTDEGDLSSSAGGANKKIVGGETTSGTGGGASAGGGSTSNNKTSKQAIVRKNNIIMEVT